MIQVDMVISTWSNVGLKGFDLIKKVWSEVEKNFKIKSNSCDTDRGNKYLSYKVGISLEDLWEDFYKLHRMEHHNVMMCLDVVITLYLIVFDK